MAKRQPLKMSKKVAKSAAEENEQENGTLDQLSSKYLAQGKFFCVDLLYRPNKHLKLSLFWEFVEFM